MKKFYNNTYKRKNNIPIVIFLFLYGLGYFILSGDIMERFGKVGLVVYSSILITLFIVHSVLVVKNWDTIVYGRND